MSVFVLSGCLSLYCLVVCLCIVLLSVFVLSGCLSLYCLVVCLCVVWLSVFVLSVTLHLLPIIMHSTFSPATKKNHYLAWIYDNMICRRHYVVPGYAVLCGLMKVQTGVLKFL